MFVCCKCCVLSGRVLCDGLITRPGESYRLWCIVCDQETSKTRRLKACYRAVENTTTMGCNIKKTNKQTLYMYYRQHVQGSNSNNVIPAENSTYVNYIQKKMNSVNHNFKIGGVFEKTLQQIAMFCQPLTKNNGM